MSLTALMVMVLSASPAKAVAHFEASPRVEKRLIVTVNNHQVYPSTGVTTVELDPRHEDLIVFSDFSGKNHRVIARFDPDATYLVQPNPCAVYEIIPQPEHSAGGSYVLRAETPQTILVGASSTALKAGQSTAPQEAAHSAMCAHSSTHFSVGTVEVGFLFINDEKIEVVASGSPAKPKLKLVITAPK